MGKCGSALVRRSGQARQRSLEDSDVGVGGDDVDMVRLDAHSVFDLVHREARRASERLAEVARVRRVEVLDEHESQAGAQWDVPEKLAESFHATRRSADAHDWKGRRMADRRDLFDVAAVRCIGAASGVSEFRHLADIRLCLSRFATRATGEVFAQSRHQVGVTPHAHVPTSPGTFGDFACLSRDLLGQLRVILATYL